MCLFFSHIVFSMPLSMVWGKFFLTIWREVPTGGTTSSSSGLLETLSSLPCSFQSPLRVNILPKDWDTAWRIVGGSLYGSGQEVKLLFCSDSVDCSHVTGFYLSAIKAGWDMQCYG